MAGGSLYLHNQIDHDDDQPQVGDLAGSQINGGQLLAQRKWQLAQLVTIFNV